MLADRAVWVLGDRGRLEHNMRTRRLGETALEVPVLAFGAYAIGGGYWGSTDDARSLEALRAAIDGGMNAIDTAPVYGFGLSEELVGNAIAGRRDEVVLMTKCGIRWDGLVGGEGKDILSPGGVKRRVELNSRPESVREEIESSLARLKVDCVDLMQVHARDPEVAVAETMGALVDLRAEGKLREIGVSNYTVQELEEARLALGDVPLASDQPQYSLLIRGIEEDILPWARERGVGLLVYSPLAQGLLTGRVTASRRFDPSEGRASKPDFKQENRTIVNEALDRVVRPIAQGHGVSVAQTVLAWTIAEPGVTSALVGARTPEQVLENIAAAEVELSSEQSATIRAAFEGVHLELGGGGLGLRARLGGIKRRLFGG